MAVRIIVEHARANEETDLRQCLAFAVENTGNVPAQLRFNDAPLAALLPVGMKREFPFLGNHYEGTLQIEFTGATAGARPLVTVIKQTLIC